MSSEVRGAGRPVTDPEEPGVPLDWLLAQERLGLRSLVDPCGPVAVRWAHSIDVADPTPWLLGGELVLTTGAYLGVDAAARHEHEEYVDRLAGIGVAALGFGVGLGHDQVPAALVAACRRTSVALVEVPLPTPFVAISQAVARHLADRQTEEYQRAVSFQQRLTRAALDRGARGIVSALERELGAEVALVDEFLRPVPPVREELTARAVGEIERLAPTARHAGVSVVDERGALELTSLPGRRRGGGWVAVQAPRALGRTERMLLNQAVSLLTLQLVRPRELAEAHRRLGAAVLDLLLDPATVSTEVASHVRHVGLSALEALRVVVVAREPRLPDRVLAGLDGLGVPHLVTTRESEAVVATRSDAADAVVDHLQAALADAAITDAWVGVSGVVTADRLAEALQSARQAARSARWARRRVARHDTLSLATVLADEPVRERVNTLAHSVLASLDEGDARSRTLRDSLEVFLRANGSWETAARNLGVHRHTLRNRMTRVEELTGLSLDVAENRVVLLLALLADDRG